MKKKYIKCHECNDKIYINGTKSMCKCFSFTTGSMLYRVNADNNDRWYVKIIPLKEDLLTNNLTIRAIFNIDTGKSIMEYFTNDNDCVFLGEIDFNIFDSDVSVLRKKANLLINLK